MTAFERKRVRLYRVAYLEDEDREIVIVQKRGRIITQGKYKGINKVTIDRLIFYSQ